MTPAYPSVLAPMGAIIVVDFFFAQRVGIPTDPAAKAGLSFNSAVLFAWLIPVGLGMYFYQYHDVFASYLPLPCAIACGLLYIAFSKLRPTPAPAHA